MLKPIEIVCSGCHSKTVVEDKTVLLKERLCQRCYDDWMALDRKATSQLTQERRRWVSYDHRGDSTR